MDNKANDIMETLELFRIKGTLLRHEITDKEAEWLSDLTGSENEQILAYFSNVIPKTLSPIDFLLFTERALYYHPGLFPSDDRALKSFSWDKLHILLDGSYIKSNTKIVLANEEIVEARNGTRSLYEAIRRIAPVIKDSPDALDMSDFPIQRANGLDDGRILIGTHLREEKKEEERMRKQDAQMRIAIKIGFVFFLIWFVWSAIQHNT